MARRFLTAKSVAQAVDLRAYGFTWAEIGDMLDCDRSALRRAAMKIGSPCKYKPVTPEALSKAKELRAQGECWKTIGRIVDHNWTTLANYISRENCGIR